MQNEGRKIDDEVRFQQCVNAKFSDSCTNQEKVFRT